ncbi:excinuclease ABC subunit C [Klebsiella michiganensis]|uniref:Excinuclease ABC subunit C n=1 Tax=Klebsiella michiganensis TaxID=1134687 RepID=A0A7H4PJT4_9ENTR|nr:excinuclease ABC subunit C [Klebsiella michiganensis]
MPAWRASTCCLSARGKVLGSRSYFPKVPNGTELGEVVETFVGQFYLQGSQMRTLPGEILLDFNLGDKTLLADSLSELAGRRVNVQTKPRGDSRPLPEAGAHERRDGADHQAFPAFNDYATFAGTGDITQASGRQSDGML